MANIIDLPDSMVVNELTLSAQGGWRDINLFHICQKLEINQAHPPTLDFSLYKARIQKVVRLRQV